MYRLEKQMEPNVAVDLDSTLESQNTLEFCLVRENSEWIHHEGWDVWSAASFTSVTVVFISDGSGLISGHCLSTTCSIVSSRLNFNTRPPLHTYTNASSFLSLVIHAKTVIKLSSDVYHYSVVVYQQYSFLSWLASCLIFFDWLSILVCMLVV